MFHPWRTGRWLLVALGLMLLIGQADRPALAWLRARMGVIPCRMDGTRVLAPADGPPAADALGGGRGSRSGARLAQCDRHLGRRTARGHHNHGGNPPVRRERQSFDHLLIGDDLIGTRRQQTVDAPDPERMLKCDGFTSRADGHAEIGRIMNPRAALFLHINSACALLARLAIAFFSGC